MDCFQGPGNRSSGDDASPEVTENTNYTWSLSGISLTYDTSDVSVFPGASDRKSGSPPIQLQSPKLSQISVSYISFTFLLVMWSCGWRVWSHSIYHLLAWQARCRQPLSGTWTCSPHHWGSRTCATKLSCCPWSCRALASSSTGCTSCRLGSTEPASALVRDRVATHWAAISWVTDDTRIIWLTICLFLVSLSLSLY